MMDPSTMSRPELNRVAVELGLTRTPERYTDRHLRIRVQKALERRSIGQSRRDAA